MHFIQIYYYVYFYNYFALYTTKNGPNANKRQFTKCENAIKCNKYLI